MVLLLKHHPRPYLHSFQISLQHHVQIQSLVKLFLGPVIHRLFVTALLMVIFSHSHCVKPQLVILMLELENPVGKLRDFPFKVL